MIVTLVDSVLIRNLYQVIRRLDSFNHISQSTARVFRHNSSRAFNTRAPRSMSRDRGGKIKIVARPMSDINLAQGVQWIWIANWLSAWHGLRIYEAVDQSVVGVRPKMRPKDAGCVIWLVILLPWSRISNSFMYGCPCVT